MYGHASELCAFQLMPLEAQFLKTIEAQWTFRVVDMDRRLVAFKDRWQPMSGDAVARFEKDIAALFVHYEFPRECWAALRTTNPIERVNKEFKRRSKSMEQMGPDGLKALLAFTALRLEYGWSMTPINSAKLANLNLSPTKRGHLAAAQLDVLSRTLLN